MGSTIGVSGVILLVILALILFGPKKLPELGRAMGNTLREFKNATRGLTKDDEEEEQAKPKPEQAAAAPEQAVIDREKLEREIRERLERERLEQEIREKLEKERLSAEQDKPQA